MRDNHAITIFNIETASQHPLTCRFFIDQKLNFNDGNIENKNKFQN